MTNYEVKYLKEIMGKPDVVKGPATDEKDSPYADGVEPVFPYDSFEKDLFFHDNTRET